MTNESALELLLIDNDPIFRMGLIAACEKFPDLKIVADTEVGKEAIQVLQSLITEESQSSGDTKITNTINLVILDIETKNLPSPTSDGISISGIGFCQQLKTSYPDLPILLLTSLQDTTILTVARELGVNGYCPKGISIPELVNIIKQVANGESYWVNTLTKETSVLQLLLIDNDPIFRMGLVAACQEFSDLNIVDDVEVGTEAIEVLQESTKEESQSSEDTKITNTINLAILDIETKNLPSPTSDDISISGIGFCEQLKTSYPNLPILLLTSLQDTTILKVARELGVNGCCPKGISIPELVKVIKEVANGESYWVNSLTKETIEENSGKLSTSGLKVQGANFFQTLRYNASKSGLKQIDISLEEVTSQLNQSLQNLDRNNLTSVLNVAINAGQRRELLTARWIVSQLLPKSFLAQKQQKNDSNTNFFSDSILTKTTNSTDDEETDLIKIEPPNLEIDNSAKDLQTVLFDVTIAKLKSNLINISGLPMEIDILRGYKKQELIYITLSTFEDILSELRSYQITLDKLTKQKYEILHNLWEITTKKFFNSDYQLEIQDRNIILTSFEEKNQVEVIPILLKDAENVHKFILDKIPLVEELIAHLLFTVPLVINNVSYQLGSPEAMQHSEALLQNLLIQIANGVMQPLLNNFSDVEKIKEDLYSRQLLSTRDIEKFRNSLSWRYRIERYVAEPKAIFESNFSLYVLNERGIKKISIYSPRRNELAKLSGIPLTVTLLLETRDAIAPGVRTTVAFIGSGVVYLLTQVIGRGIGLIGRGIIQGIGNSFQDVKLGKNNNRSEAKRNNEEGKREKGIT
ncbi:MAG: DUF3685 domain-containing protein [Microcoleaceae cyanobacterium]